MWQIKVIVERNPDCFVAYPLGLKGVVVGQGDSFEAALADVTSAISFHIETFGLDTFGGGTPSLGSFSYRSTS
jgi:predicted RNase H-like HicB family nuclease